MSINADFPRLARPSPWSCACRFFERMVSTVLVVYSVVLGVVVLCTNALVLAGQYQLRKDLTNNLYIVSLACSNIIVGLVIFVNTTLELATAGTVFSAARSVAYQMILTYVQMLSMSANIFCMVAIAVDL